ncbi:MAG: cytochrome c biogenesis protein CcsA, partial [Brevinematales bacterium]
METILLAAGAAALAGYILSGINSCRRGRFLGYAGIISFLSWIIVRSLGSGHAPFSGIYESMVFFAFLYFVKIALLSRFPEKTKAVTLLPALAMASVALFLPDGMKTAGPGSPALESFWIWLHVPGIFIGYVSLTIGFILAIISNAGNKTAENYLDDEMRIAFYFTAL